MPMKTQTRFTFQNEKNAVIMMNERLLPHQGGLQGQGGISSWFPQPAGGLTACPRQTYSRTQTPTRGIW